MTTQYTPILKLALPVTGELSGTWGDVVNDNITSMVEQAITGRATFSTWTANAHTLTVADGTTSESRCIMLDGSTGSGGTALTAAGNVICPTQTKPYIFKNSSAYSLTLKTSGGTGITVPSGKTSYLTCDGTNVVNAVDYLDTLTVQDSTFRIVDNVDQSKVLQFQVSGLTTATTRTLTAPDNSGTILTTGATVTVPQGGTGLTSGTSGGVLYFSGATTMASSAALAANAIVLGGGAGAAPATTTTGTGVVTALGVNVGSAGAFVVNGGALGTPSSGTVTNLTGTASININGTVGATTPNTGAFTTLSTTGALTYGGVTLNNAVTGTGNMVLSASPTLTGTVSASALSVSSGAATAIQVTADAGYSLFNGRTNSSGGRVSITGNSTGNGININAFNDAQSGYEPFNVLGSTINVKPSASTIASFTSTGLRIGSGTAPTVALDVTGAALISSTLGVTGIITGTKNNAEQFNAQGYAAITGVASALNGMVAIGSQAAYQGRIQYEGATNARLYIDNTYNNAGGTINFRVRTAGTPVTTLSLSDTGASVTGTGAFTGTVGIGTTAQTNAQLYAVATALSGTTQYGIRGALTGTSGATSIIVADANEATTAAAAYTCSEVINYYAVTTAKGAGSTQTNRTGFYVDDLTSGTNNYGFRGTLSSGANKYNLYMSGSAANYFAGDLTVYGGTAIPAGGTTGSGYKFSSTANFGVFFGSGAPTLSAAKGSLYLRSDGTTTNDRMYVNTDGGTTWTAVTTAA